MAGANRSGLCLDQWELARMAFWEERFRFFDGSEDRKGRYADSCVQEWYCRFPKPGSGAFVGVCAGGCELASCTDVDEDLKKCECGCGFTVRKECQYV